MKKLIKDVEAATYKQYNANTRGTNTGDCVKRSLSMAFDIDYNEVGKALNAIMKELHRDAWNVAPVFEKFITMHGGSDRIAPPEKGLLLDDWIDQYATIGTYIVETGSKPCGVGGGNHLVCVIDGQIFDSWDSRNEYVAHYYTVEGRAQLVLSDIQDHLTELGVQAVNGILENIKKYIKKYDMGDYVRYKVTEFKSSGYGIKVPVHIYVDKYDNKSYHFKIAYMFTPTTSYEEAQKKVKEITNIRMYDRFYAIRKELEGKEEGEQLAAQSGKKYEYYQTFGGAEERFINSLPGWVKPFIAHVYIDRPGVYSDSYTMTIHPIPGDPNQSESVRFYGYDSSMIKEELKLYKNGYERPGYDYDVSELT